MSNSTIVTPPAVADNSGMRLGGLSKPMLFGLVAGPLCFVVASLTPAPLGMSGDAWTVLGVVIWVGFWWALEPVPIPVTSLLPMLLFPLLGVGRASEVANEYAGPVIFLLLGGFMLAKALERWNLHMRFALSILVRTGRGPAGLIAGLMLATALISMWVSNTATTLMILPIGLSISRALVPEESVQHRNVIICVALSIGYAASIGGLGSLIGTPPNLLMVGYLAEHHAIHISFVDWFVFGLPIVVLMLPLAWLVLTRVVYRFDTTGERQDESVLNRSLSALGSLSIAEKRLFGLFVLTVVMWCARPLIVSVTGFPLTDTAIAIVAAMALFIVPSGQNSPLMNWESAASIPWDVLLLYGGGMALAAAVTQSGLGTWLAGQLQDVSHFHVYGLIVTVTALVLLVTEITNNSAAIAMLLPVLSALSAAADIDVLNLVIPAVIAASCAFMLPVATPPNAVVYSSGVVTIPQMAIGGVALNLIGLMLIPIVSYLLIGWING